LPLHALELKLPFNAITRLKHTPSSREAENRQLAQEMLALHEEVRVIYGYRRLTLNVSRRAKKQINHKRIQRLMKIQGIQSVIIAFNYLYCLLDGVLFTFGSLFFLNPCRGSRAKGV
jgi:hypothetical protein